MGSPESFGPGALSPPPAIGGMGLLDDVQPLPDPSMLESWPEHQQPLHEDMARPTSSPRGGDGRAPDLTDKQALITALINQVGTPWAQLYVVQ